MIIPAVIDGPFGRENRPPMLGESGAWSLFWNSQFATHWAGLRPAWRLEASLRARDGKPATRMFGEKHVRIAAVAESKNVSVECVLYDSLPDVVTLTGAVRMTARSESGKPNRLVPRPTRATVVRMQLVSIVLDQRPNFNIVDPDPNRQWHTLQPIAGTEWFYELAEPPTTLHTYRPPEGEYGELRQELLLIDLDTDI